MSENRNFFQRFFRPDVASQAPKEHTKQVPKEDVDTLLASVDQSELHTFEIQVWKNHTSDGDPVGKRITLLSNLLRNPDVVSVSLGHLYYNFEVAKIDRLKLRVDLGSRKNYLKAIFTYGFEEKFRQGLITKEDRLKVWFLCESYVKRWARDYLRYQYEILEVSLNYQDKPEVELGRLLFFLNQVAAVDSHFGQELIALLASTYHQEIQRLNKKGTTVWVSQDFKSIFECFGQLGELVSEQRFTRAEKRVARTTAGLVEDLLLASKNSNAEQVRGFFAGLSPAEQDRLVQKLVTGQEDVIKSDFMRTMVADWLRVSGQELLNIDATLTYDPRIKNELQLHPEGLIEKYCYYLVDLRPPDSLTQIARSIQLLDTMLTDEVLLRIENTKLETLIHETLYQVYRLTMEPYKKNKDQSRLNTEEVQHIKLVMNSLQQIASHYLSIVTIPNSRWLSYGSNFYSLAKDASQNLEIYKYPVKPIVWTHFPEDAGDAFTYGIDSATATDHYLAPAWSKEVPPSTTTQSEFAFTVDDFTSEQWETLLFLQATQSETHSVQSTNLENDTLNDICDYLDKVRRDSSEEITAWLTKKERALKEPEPLPPPEKIDYIKLTNQYEEVLGLFKKQGLFTPEMVTMLEEVIAPFDIILDSDRIWYTSYMPETADQPSFGKGKLEFGLAGRMAEYESVKSILANLGLSLTDQVLENVVDKYVLSHELTHALENAVLLRMLHQWRKKFEEKVDLTNADIMKKLIFLLWKRKARAIMSAAPLDNVPDGIAEIMTVERASTGMGLVVLGYLLQEAGLSALQANQVVTELKNEKTDAFNSYVQRAEKDGGDRVFERALEIFAKENERDDGQGVDFVPLGYMYPLSETEIKKLLPKLVGG